MINNVILMGRLTHNIELKTTKSGSSVASFSLAVDRNYVKQGEERKADFFNCTCWNKTAEFVAKYFGKGNLIAVIGELQTDEYTDKNGNNRVRTFVNVTDVSFTGERNDQNGSSQSVHQAVNNEIEQGYIDIDEDLPF